MAGSLNRVMLIGRLTRNPELKTITNGSVVCNFGIATNRYSRDAQSGENKEFTDFNDLVVWNMGTRKLAELCASSLVKGSLAYFEGRLQTRSWDDQASGQKRYKTEVNVSDVQFLEPKREGAGAPPAPPEVGAVDEIGKAFPEGMPQSVDAPTDPDDIPF